MSQPPLILVSPDIEAKGKEFADRSTSLSNRYEEAIIGAGGLPLTMPATAAPEVVRECVRRCDGILLTGGDDVAPELYGSLPESVRKTVHVTPDAGARDFRELIVIEEAFKQQKPLLAICRGQQIVNVALGGTLVGDIPSQIRGAINHRRTDRRSEIVHEVRLTQGSLLAKIAAGQTLGVNSTHHQSVGRVAPQLQVAGRADDGVVEALELKPGSASLPFFLSVQFHPERLADRYPQHRAIFLAFVRACGPSREAPL
jgi:putative glutamine amidotransferase